MITGLIGNWCGLWWACLILSQSIIEGAITAQPLPSYTLPEIAARPPVGAFRLLDARCDPARAVRWQERRSKSKGGGSYLVDEQEIPLVSASEPDGPIYAWTGACASPDRALVTGQISGVALRKMLDADLPSPADAPTLRLLPSDAENRARATSDLQFLLLTAALNLGLSLYLARPASSPPPTPPPRSTP